MTLAEISTERVGDLRVWSVYEEAVMRGKDNLNFSVGAEWVPEAVAAFLVTRLSIDKAYDSLNLQ